jgi:2-polyprenyl-3-methyl-5-hydroxy-6-metoxy-1,4-benzoquinol methylase
MMTMATDTTPLSPDTHAAGFRGVAPDALRYDGHTDDPAEVAGILHTLMPAGIKVLDIGCGTGSVALIANRGKGNQVVAVEPDPARAAVAAKRGLDVTCGFLDADFVARHGPFDIVMMSDVMEHLAAPADMVSLVRAGLTENGAMLVSVPNVAHWSVRLGLMFGRSIMLMLVSWMRRIYAGSLPGQFANFSNAMGSQ